MCSMYFLRILKCELKYCKVMLRLMEAKVAKLPPGKVFVGKSHNKVCFYLIDESNKRKFLNNEYDVVQELCARECTEKGILKLKKEIRILEKLIDLLENDNWRDFESYIHPEKLKAAELEFNDKYFCEEWMSNLYYTMKPTATPAGLVNGHAMRSKSEVIFAEILLSLGVYYHYEEEIILPNGEMVCPDFTIMDPYTHEVIYFEHFGMLDDPEYAAKTFEKIKKYANNGIFINERLFCTFETSVFHFPFECIKPFLEKRFGF